jgi:NAD(P)-dependent dehydrogenase (short-subunit alcohol dehydrogenase family)
VSPVGAPTFDFSGQVVLVTGGRRGVGAGIVTAFLAAGASVMACGRPEEVDAKGDVEGAAFVTADIRQAEQARLAVDTAVERFGRLDVLVNVAGDSPPVAAPASPQTDESAVAASLLAPFYCAQAAQPIMARQAEGGAIVNVASISGLRPSPGTSAYGAANAGLISLSSTLAVEWAPLIRVSCVSIHLLEAEGEIEAEGEGGAGSVASAPVADVASACLFLASPAATFVTGAHLEVPGGGGWPKYLTAQGQA